jgi:hypothetical protein
MTVIALNHTRRSCARLAASDDAQRMLLCCVLRDAGEFHSAAIGECPACLAFPEPGGPCDACWESRRPSYTAYHDLADRLASYDGLPYGEAYPLVDDDRQVIAAALPEAIAYRQQHAGSGVEHHVLLMAYRELNAAKASTDQLSARRRAGQGRGTRASSSTRPSSCPPSSWPGSGHQGVIERGGCRAARPRLSSCPPSSWRSSGRGATLTTFRLTRFRSAECRENAGEHSAHTC